MPLFSWEHPRLCRGGSKGSTVTEIIVPGEKVTPHPHDKQSVGPPPRARW
jgi:hypothetical protein